MEYFIYHFVLPLCSDSPYQQHFVIINIIRKFPFSIFLHETSSVYGILSFYL